MGKRAGRSWNWARGQQWWQGRYTLAEYHERLKSVPNLQHAEVADAAHMLHHDQPAQLALLIEGFCA